jgi:molybdopterin-binding protein
MMLSACNLVPAKVVRIRQGEASSAPAAVIASSITLEAVSDLGILERSDVSAVVKVSDVMIAIGD